MSEQDFGDRWKSIASELGIEITPTKPEPPGKKEEAEAQAPIAEPEPSEPVADEEPASAPEAHAEAADIADSKLTEQAAEPVLEEEKKVAETDTAETETELESPAAPPEEEEEEKSGKGRKRRKRKRGKKTESAESKQDEDSDDEERKSRKRKRSKKRQKEKVADNGETTREIDGSADDEIDKEVFESGNDEDDDVVEPEDYSDWSVPSWQEIIAGLYRPDR